jgi:anti-sigma-K factor RskA
MAETVDIHALAGAYALDAVDDIERKAFERHLRDCGSCMIEVEELKETTSWLSHPVAATPPPALRDRVFAQIAQTPQDTRKRAAPGGSASPTRWRRWTAAAVAAGIIGAGAGAGTWVVSEQRLRHERVVTAQIEAVLSAPDATLVRTKGRGGDISLVVSPSRDAAVAVLRGLEKPDDKHAYQLWMVGGTTGGGAPFSVGIMPAGAGSGRAYITGLKGATTFAVSEEIAKGALQPTSIVGKVPF